MPRGIDLHIPFPRRISRDVDRARDQHLHWPRSHGLLEGEEVVRRHAGARYAELAARFYPDAVGEELDLGVDLMSWFFLFDDTFDGPDGEDPARAGLLVESVTQVLRRPATPADPPAVRAFSDLWRRSCDGMSPQWRQRAAEHWRTYLSGYVLEANHRQLGLMPTVEEHLLLRRETIGVYPTVDLAERIGGFEVPEHVYADGRLTAMRHIAAEVDTIHNDLCSVEKEEARGEIHNLLLILERQGCTRAEAVEEMRRMIRSRTERFLVLETGLTGLCDSFRLTEARRVSVHRFADALRAVMRGDYDWAEQSGRYATENTPREQETAP
ncbi:terpene synthase family protein [Streptomyces albipurpureus]|uniref:Terpene synthase n=1 Tax=Streptomyces albipurpureus TaxID=2897419 RepID=A0ABT0UYN7_9ACTN|nr:pentalenene synthase [Streptomyces sp. CWNU-1]MCM2393687.1 pentalenene synthase [Streptomyces sp. CWNU-1]